MSNRVQLQGQVHVERGGEGALRLELCDCRATSDAGCKSPGNPRGPLPNSPMLTRGKRGFQISSIWEEMLPDFIDLESAPF